MRGAVVGVLLAVVAGRAHADSLEATGADEDAAMSERSHTVDVAIRDRTATFQVERELVNRGSAVVRAELALDTPTRAVARSFRQRSGDRWIDGGLLGADAASESFDRLTTTGAQREHGPAVLTWIDDGALQVRAYPVPAGARLRVAYTLEAPACYAAGRWITDYPMAGADLAPVTLRAPGAQILTAAQLATALGASVDDACASDVPITGDDQHRYIVVDAGEAEPFAVRFARASAGGDDVARVQIDVARELAPLPRQARVVFVVDASRSMGTSGVADQLAWIAGYLAHVPDAHVEVVLYRRTAERLFGGFEAAPRAIARLGAIDPAAVAPGNGSHLDRGLMVAAALLAPAGGPRRVIAFTDERWRPALDADGVGAALGALPPDAIVHLVRLSGEDGAGAPSLERSDDGDLAAVAARWGGMLVDASGGAVAPAAAYAAAALELVRPLRVDGVIVHRTVAARDGEKPDDDANDDDLASLAAGAGVSVSWRAPAGSAVAIEGRVWGRRFRRELVSDAATSRAWAGQAIGDPVRESLGDAEVLALATAGAVASPMTSFLAIDARWPAAGLPDDWGEAACGCDTSSSIRVGYSSTVGIGCSGLPPGTPVPERSAEVALRDLLAPRVLACAAQTRQRAWKLAVGVDTTGDEIVDVDVGGATGAFAACVEDAAWELVLDDRFVRFTGHYVAQLGGAR